MIELANWLINRAFLFRKALRKSVDHSLNGFRKFVFHIPKTQVCSFFLDPE